MRRGQKACRCHKCQKVQRLSDQTRKGCSEESRDDNADSTDRGVPVRQYDPKLIRPRSRFEGVRTPTTELNGRLRTKTALEQTSRTSTSTRDRGICSRYTHDAGERWSEKKSGKPTTVSRTDTISKAATKEGVVHQGRTRGCSSYKLSLIHI